MERTHVTWTSVAFVAVVAVMVCGGAVVPLHSAAANSAAQRTSGDPTVALKRDDLIPPRGESAGGETHEVLTFDFAFSPQHITVAPGDMVRWIWVSGIHTATSGVGCGASGLVFHGWVTPAIPIYEWVVPADLEPGEIPYVCLPHCAMGMVGTVTVEPAGPDCPADINDDGVVDVLDLLILLDAWGPCGDPDACPEDLSGDGDVDVLDLLQLLDAWGECPRFGEKLTAETQRTQSRRWMINRG